MTRARMTMFFVVLLLLYAGMNFYIARRLYQWVSLLFPKINAIVFSAIYTLTALSVIFAFLPANSGVGIALRWFGAHWMGGFLYFIIFFLTADIVMLLGRLIKLIPNPRPQSVSFVAGLLVLLMVTGFVSYGRYNANQIKHTAYTIQLSEPSPASGINLVMISDLHLGAVNSENNLVDIVERINDLEPDIVCVVGDIIDGDYTAIQNPSQASELLKSIKSTYGVYACLGNHDAGSTFNEMVRFFDQSNIILLNDESVVIDNRLVLIGRIDGSPIGGAGDLQRGDIVEILAETDTNMPIVVMDHNPGNIEQYGEDIDLVLSGHTHKGQIFPGNLITNVIYAVDYGYYKQDAYSPNIIVTSGVGTWGPPMRIGTDNEIVSILLQ